MISQGGSVKKLSLIFLLLLLESASHASETPVTLKMHLTLNGKAVSAPQLIVLSGQTGKITQESSDHSGSYSIEVSPLVRADRSVELHFVVSEEAAGVEKILSKPKVIVLNNHMALIEQREKGKPALKLSVTPSF